METYHFHSVAAALRFAKFYSKLHSTLGCILRDMTEAEMMCVDFAVQVSYAVDVYHA